MQRRKPAQIKLHMQRALAMHDDHIRMLDAPTYPYAFIEHGEIHIELRDAVITNGDELLATVVLRKRSTGQLA